MNGVRVILAIAALLAGPASADTVDAIVRRDMNRDRIPGVALLVMRAGRVERSAGYGLANVEHGVPVTRATMFQSGSLGKHFTAAAVLLLAERGRLSLDDRIDKYLPAGPPGWEAITIRQLLEHTSGIRDSEDGGEIFDLRHEYSDAELLRVLQSYPLDFAPGSRWKYNNSGYILAGIVVTRVAGMFYGDFLARELFQPLAMHTARIISDSDIVPNRAAGYVRTAGGIRNQDFASAALNATADGSLYLSLEDWSTWVAALDTRALLSPASWDAFWGRTRTSAGELVEHAYCWDYASVGGHVLLEFDGTWQGFRTAIARDPATRLTVVVLANLAEARPERTARAVLAAVAGWRAPTADQE